MDHNNLEEDDFIDRFSAQDLANHRLKGRPYKVIKDEVFGRYRNKLKSLEHIRISESDP